MGVKWKFNFENSYEHLEDCDVHISFCLHNADTLCGQERQGISSMYVTYNEFIATKESINCRQCLDILNFCKNYSE